MVKKVVVLGNSPKTLVQFRGHLLKTIAESGHQVVASTPGHPSADFEPLKQAGVRHKTIAFSRTSINPIRDLLYLARVFVFLALERPHVVFCYTIKPVIYGSIAARLFAQSDVFSLMSGLGFTLSPSSGSSSWLRSVIKMICRFSLKKNKKVLFQNPDDKRELVEQGILASRDRGCVVNGSGVDLEEYEYSKPDSEQISFLMTCRLLKDKGVIEYFEAAKALKSEFPGVKFSILGPLDENPAAISKDLLEEWRQTGVIDYLGETVDVRPYVRNCSVFVLPSYREGTPRTVLEAMAMGRPIVTTDVPGCKETVVHGVNGRLVIPRDSNSLAASMKTFIDNPERIEPMGRESRRIAEEKYDVNKVNEIIRRILGLI